MIPLARRFSFLLLLAQLARPVATAAEPPWSFVVMGDTRDRTKATLTGISPDLDRLARAIAAEKPDLVIHTGDLINGYYTAPDSPVHGEFRRQLATWKAAVRPIYDFEARTGIPIYAVRGNHEDGMLVTDPALRQAYVEEIGVTVPQNGPEAERGLTYVVSHKGARFFALDGYEVTRARLIRGYVNQEWLDAQLASGTQPFVFAYSHTPAYAVSQYKSSPFPDLYSHPEKRDALWASLVRSGALAYFCGHIHLYTRGSVASVEQVVVGNGGASMASFDARDVDPKVEIHFPRQPRMSASEMRTGYLVVTVDEGARLATGVQKLWDPAARAWVDGDRFSLRLRERPAGGAASGTATR
jgi:hypothetical protein